MTLVENTHHVFGLGKALGFDKQVDFSMDCKALNQGLAVAKC